MKKTNYSRKALLMVTFVASVLIIASCGNRQRSSDTRDVAQERNEARFDDKKQENDAQFLVNAAEINLNQIRLGQLAQQKGNTTHVKELGKMMEGTYTKAQRDLTALAGSKRINIPTTPTHDSRDTYEDLNEKSGDDFDKAYADMMVSQHEDAIKTFEDASKDRNDTEIKNWAIATLPELRINLNHSIDLQKRYDERSSK